MSKHDMSRMLANDGNKESRRELDFYPTPPECTIALMDFLDWRGMKIWEPACGDGSMSKVLESYGNKVTSTDISTDTGYGEGGVDFLMDPPITTHAIITNPPFNLSEEFIRHALSITPNVAMLLKSQYWHAKSRKKLFDDTRPAWVLPLTWRPDFLFNQRLPGETARPTMEVAWTVWMSGSDGCRYIPLAKPVTNKLTLSP